MCVASFVARSQHSDFASWLGVGTSKELFDKLDVSLGVEARTKNNSTAIDQAFAELGMEYKLHKLLSLIASYRAIAANDKGVLEDEHRFFAGASTDFKVGNIKIAIKSRYQKKFSEMYEHGWASPKNTLRNKVGAKYHIFGTPYRPTISCELFNPYGANGFELISKARYSVGIDYLISKKRVVNLFYLYQQEYNTSNAESLHVVGLGYEFDL